MAYTRKAVVKQAQSWIGRKESDGSFKEIVDVYNSHTPLARGYKLQYTDPWCAGFVSAVAIKCGCTAIMPTEVGCDEMIQLYKKLGCWMEDDSYIPAPGDVIFYDWQDTTGSTSDNMGASDHVGIVGNVSGSTVTVIEGNKSNAVGTRTLRVNGQYIRGYGLPKYADGTSSTVSAPAGAAADPQSIWTYLIGRIGNAFGVAGLMGNLHDESGLIPNNLQNTYNTRLGMTDAAYTAAVDDGSYTNFVKDSAGYGIAQWTHGSRKQALLDYAKAQNASIGNLDMQLAFLCKELSENYASVWKTLKNATSVLQASNTVLTKYEQPADQGAAVQKTRASYGQSFYDKYASSASVPGSTSGQSPTDEDGIEYAQCKDNSLAGKYTVTAASGLRLRTGAGTNKGILAVMPKGSTVYNYGYYTDAEGFKWMLVTYKTYKGFCSYEYLKKMA